MRHRSYAFIGAAALVAAIACGGEKEEHAAATPSIAPSPSAPADVKPCATCKVIEITMTSTEKGNFFTPNKFEAHEGDVLRFKLLIGVHNVNFLPDSNPGKKNLPPVTEMLQLPGQTVDILLNFGTGRFYFQCDPHALLGMVGHVKVEEREGR
jgi:plastocyanin